MTNAREREALAACGRELWERGLVSGTSGNLSLRLAGGNLLVTPAARSLRNLELEELVLTDSAGAPAGAGRPTSELPLHLACYAARPDITAIVHTHPTFCVVWSKRGRVFEQDTVGARESLGPVAWTGYEPPGSDALAHAVAVAAGAPFDTILMEKHGLTAVGVTLEQAFIRTDLAEEAAKIGFYSHVMLTGYAEQPRAGND